MALLMKRNRYVWRLDLSLLGEENYNSEIGREVKKHLLSYKTWLLIAKFCLGGMILTPIVLFICHAEIIYIELSGITALVLTWLYGKLLIIPKITENDIKILEDELNRKSDRMDDFNAIFTENTLIVQRGLMVYRIPFNEIMQIKVQTRRGKGDGHHVRYRLCDGTNIEIMYYENSSQSFLQSFKLFREQLLKYNPNIVIEVKGWRGIKFKRIR